MLSRILRANLSKKNYVKPTVFSSTILIQQLIDNSTRNVIIKFKLDLFLKFELSPSCRLQAQTLDKSSLCAIIGDKNTSTFRP